MSSISTEPGDFPDDEVTSDHRPVLATFRLPAAGAPVVMSAVASSASDGVTLSEREAILARLDALDEEVHALRSLLREE